MIRDDRRQNAPQPRQKFRFRPSTKPAEVLVRFQKSLLHQVRRIRLPLQPSTDLRPRQNSQIRPKSLHQRAERLSFSVSCPMKKLLATAFQAHPPILPTTPPSSQSNSPQTRYHTSHYLSRMNVASGCHWRLASADPSSQPK